MAISWIATAARTGAILAELPEFVPGGMIGATIGAYVTLTGSLPLPDDVIAYANDSDPDGDPPLSQLADWRAATQPGRVILVALDEDDQPLQGYLVLQRNTSASAGADLSLVSAEAYFDRRYIGDKTYAAQTQASIVSDLISSFIADGTIPGLPITVNIVDGGATRDRAYLSSDDKTVYSGLGELMGVLNGAEWSISWRRLSSPERIVPVLNVATRLGTAAPAGLLPAAYFSMPGCVSDATLGEDYSSGNGANIVTATSTAAGDVRPTATATASDFLGLPAYEYRYSPSSSITDPATLGFHASQALSVLLAGSTSLTLACTLSASPPKLNTDWRIGDDIAYDLVAPAWLDGLTGSARVIGWQRNDTTIVPILAAPALDSST